MALAQFTIPCTPYYVGKSFYLFTIFGHPQPALYLKTPPVHANARPDSLMSVPGEKTVNIAKALEALTE